MKHRPPTITIGIPAYNEGANIGPLLRDLLSQKRDGFDLTQIIVGSDGSTDSTVQEVRKFKSGHIKLLESKNRQGLASNQNHILESATGDVLVLINADVALTDQYFLKKLVLPIVRDGVDLATANLIETRPRTFIEKLAASGFNYKKRVFENYQEGNNWFTCHGAARAFSRSFYRNFRFKWDIGEDMFSYFYCIKHGYTYKYIKKAVVHYKLADNLIDHYRQSSRFFNSRTAMEREFGAEFVKKNYAWPVKTFVIEWIKFLARNPLFAFLYPFLTYAVKSNSLILNKQQLADKWPMATSTKIVNIV